MNHGGKRVGAGRPAGSKNKRSLLLIDTITEQGDTPLEHLVKVYRNENLDDRMRLDAAKSAAPYFHAKINSMPSQVNEAPFHPLAEVEIDEEIQKLLGT